MHDYLTLRRDTTFILGAGFSKCAGLPLQSDFSGILLADEFDTDLDRAITKNVSEFISDVFGWEIGEPLPTLEDIFTCVDLSAATGHHLGIKYTPKLLRALRRMMIYRVFSVLDLRFSYSNDIETLLQQSYDPANRASNAAFIVLNWDIVLEKHIRRLRPTPSIDYCCDCYDWNLPLNPQQPNGIRVCKMHGSSNWVYCENCKSLFFDLDQKLALYKRAGLVKSDFRLFDEKFTDRAFDDALEIPPDERECRFCRNMISTHIATFSYTKSFRTHAYPSIWHAAEQLLADSNRWIFIGYSLPEADYELKHLLKVAQLRTSHLKNEKRKIDVVVHGDQHTGSKFERFFGKGAITYHNGGLSEYISKLAEVDRNQN